MRDLSKFYKSELVSFITSRNIRFISPGNLWVAGCFSLNFGGIL